MKIILISIFASSCICFSSFANEKTFFEATKVPGENKLQRGKDLKNTPQRQVKDNFAAHLIITSDKTVFKRWNQPSEVFSFKSSQTISKGEVFFPLFVYWNPQKDFKQIARVTYVIEILKPDGTVYAKENLEAGEGVLNHEGALLVKNYLAVSIEDKDPFGIYKVNVYVRDEVARNDLVLTSKFEVIKSKIKNVDLPTEEELGQFMTYFYRGDKVNVFPEMLKFSDQIPGWYDRGDTWMYFLSEVFKKHSDKLSSWIPAFNELSNSGKNLFWDALWQAHTSQSLKTLTNLKVKADVAGQKYIDLLLNSKYVPLDKKKITSPSDLDNNWGAFMASGAEAYAKNVINEVKPTQGKTGVDLQIAISARWSLTSNCQQHPHILGIVERVYVAKDDNQIKKILEEIILEGRKPINK